MEEGIDLSGHTPDAANGATFFKAQPHLLQYRPELRHPDVDTLVAPQIFPQFHQRPIRLLFHPQAQVLGCPSRDPALSATLASRRSFLLPRPTKSR